MAIFNSYVSLPEGSCSRVLESLGSTSESAFLTGARFPAPVRAETQ